MFDSDNMYHLEPEERDYKTTLLSWSFNLRPPPPRSPGRWLCKFVCPQLQLEHRQNTCLPAEYA